MNEAQSEDAGDHRRVQHRRRRDVFDKTAGTIQEHADKLSAMDTIAVSEGEELDRQLGHDQPEDRGGRGPRGPEGEACW